MDMDFKLDLFNQVNDNLKEEESIFLIYYNELTKENITSFAGDMQYLVSMIVENNQPNQEVLKAYILNAAVNLIEKEPHLYLDVMKDFCNNLK
jgi:hypothetical protein